MRITKRAMPTLPRLLHGLGEQRVGLERRLVGGHVVRRVVEERVDVDEVDELLDVDRAAGLGVERRRARRRRR